MQPSQSKRVLFLSPQPFFQRRGSPIRVGFDVRALAELGYAVDLLTFPIGEDVSIPGVRLLRIPNIIRVRRMAIGPSLPKLILDIVMFFKALGLARRHRYAVIHGIEEAGALGVLLARLTHCRLVYERHSDPVSHRKGGLRDIVLAAYAWVERFTARHAAAVIGTGQGLVDQVRTFAPLTTTHHIPDIPSSLVKATQANTARIRDQLRQSDDELLIAFVGSFAVYQGIDLLFESIPRVVPRCPHARFVIIGGSDEQIVARRDALRGQGAEQAVTFLGTIDPDALPDYLAAADILLSPRLSGVNTPLKLLDYMKAGRPIVATRTPANCLILTDDIAQLVEPTPEAFAAGIVSLTENPERRIALAAGGERLLRETYNFGEFKRRLSACYDGLPA